MRPKIIINGDDFGYSEGVNEGIRKAYTNGILTSTSVLANIVQPASLSLSNNSGLTKPPLGIGTHLNLTFGKPLEPALWTFTAFTRPFKEEDPEKEWKGKEWKEYFGKFDEEDIEKEFCAQIEKVQSLFGTLDHVDSHHGSASYPPLDKAYMAVAKKYTLAVRPLSPFSEKSIYAGKFIVNIDSIQAARAQHIRTVDSACMEYWHEKPDPISAFLKDIATVKANEVREYMFHPSTDLSQGAWRMKDLEILMDKEVLATIKRLDIQLTTYGEEAK